MLASSTYLYEKNTKVSSDKVNSVIKKENEFSLSIEVNGSLNKIGERFAYQIFGGQNIPHLFDKFYFVFSIKKVYDFFISSKLIKNNSSPI